MNKSFFSLAVLGTLLITSCSNNKPLLNVEIVESNDLTSLSYSPKMDFESVEDSATTLLQPIDYNKMLGGGMRKGATIHKAKNFDIKVLLLENYATGDVRYQMLLRSYSKDLKIIDTYIIANTTGEIMCEGQITKDLKIKKSCDDDSEVIAHVDQYGKFIDATE